MKPADIVNLSEEEQAYMRQLEFPQMIRDLVESGAEEIEICIDAHSALRIAQAVELMTQMEALQNGE
jgi:predicted ATPase